MAWYKDWFDSPLYDKLYAHRDDNEAAKLAEMITQIAPPEQFPKALDLASGRGRHSINLSNRGFSVTGTDLSPNALEIARKKAEQAQLNINFIRLDMRNSLPERFNLIVNLFTSFGYFEEDEENLSVVTSMANMLKPNGLVVIDYLNCTKTAQGLVEKESGTLDGISYSISRWIENEMVFKKMEFVDNDNQTHSFIERVKLYNRKWFTSALSKAGLQPVHYFGNYSGDEFQPETSPRLITIAQKHD